MTVVHVLEAFETGCARHLVDIVEWTDADHVVVVPPARGGGHTDPRAMERLTAAGAAVHVVDMRRSPTHPANAAAVRAVRRLVRTTSADVVHGHSSIGGVVARVAAAGTRVPTVYTPNGLATGPLARGVEQTLRPLTTVLVAVSPSERDEVLRRRLVRDARVAMIPNGIDPTLPPPPSPSLREMIDAPADVPLVGSIGRLVAQKAPLDLVTAWGRIGARARSARFVLVGDGPLAAAVDDLAADVGLAGRYRRLAFLPDADAHLRDLDVFTLASRFEGAPYVVLEAMRAGVPVVATRVVGTVDLLEGGAGTLVPVGEPGRLADATCAVLDHSPGTEVARSRVAERYDVRWLGERYARLYDALGRAGVAWPRDEEVT